MNYISLGKPMHSVFSTDGGDVYSAIVATMAGAQGFSSCMAIIHYPMNCLIHTPLITVARGKANPSQARGEFYGEAMKMDVFQAFHFLEVDLINLFRFDRIDCVAPIQAKLLLSHNGQYFIEHFRAFCGALSINHSSPCAP